MYFPADYFRSNFSSIQTLTLRFSGYLWILFPKNATEYKSCKWVFLKELDRTVSFIVSDFRVCNWVILKARFQLVSSGMRIGRVGMIRIIGIWNKKNRIVLKMDWKLSAGFLRMRCCFGQPIWHCQVIYNYFILFTLPPIAEYMGCHKLPL